MLTLSLYDVFEQRILQTGGEGLALGASPECALILDNLPGVMPQHAELKVSNGRAVLALASGASAIVDGEFTVGQTVELDTQHTVIVGGHPIILFVGRAGEELKKTIEFDQWFAYRLDNDIKYGPGDPAALYASILGWPAHIISQAIIYPKGCPTGFFGNHFVEAAANRYNGGSSQDNYFSGAPPIPPDTPVFGETTSPGASIQPDQGDYLCPVCWLKFDQGDAMHISVHGSLRGDPVLGEEHMQRFHASRFNDRGQAIDAMGLPCTDMACPHCRRKLPPGYFDSPHHIFSVVGAPSSGKSYFLSVLVKQLQSCLFTRFGLVFRDADPSGNALLNQMKAKLFSSSSPQEAALIKTQLEGEMYEMLPRLGRKVALPKPFIFQVSRSQSEGQKFSLVFYDNAGEHFEPNRNSVDSPGAQHIASAQAIFFLFDPLHNSSFRRMLSPDRDPQLDNSEQRRLGGDQQDVILTESEVRIKQVLGMDTRNRLSTPLAFMVGKYDAWRDLPGLPEFEDPIGKGELKMDAIRKNSDSLREFLLDVDPAVVANAEAISSNVCYFPISPLGAPPVKFTDEFGETKIGPDPALLNPIMVEVPVLWALSQIEPAYVPGR